MPPELTPEQEAAQADERACGERISYWLEKFGCAMIPVVEIRPGQVSARIDIQKIPPEMLKEMKKAKKNGTNPYGPATPSS